MTTDYILKRLQQELVHREIDWSYSIWEGCYNDFEYDFLARHELASRYPELDWSNPEHENMLLEMALDSHARKWKPEYLKGGWTRKTFCMDGLRDLFIYYNIWTEIK